MMTFKKFGDVVARQDEPGSGQAVGVAADMTLFADATGARLPVFTNSQIAAYLREGYWSPRSFNLGDSGADPKGGVLHYKLAGLTAPVRHLAEQAILVYESVLDVDFVRSASRSTRVVDIFVDDASAGAFTSMVGQDGRISYAEVNIGRDWSAEYGTGIDSYTFQTILHELGHALGLGHAGDYDGHSTYVTATTDPEYGMNSNIYLNDSWQATMMSYFNQEENTFVDASYAFLLSPMVADWIALGQMYPLKTPHAGDTTWGFNSTVNGTIFAGLATYADACAFTIVDGGGIDTVDFSGYASDQTIRLNPESISSIGGLAGNMLVARGTRLENAVGGGGDDTMMGTGRHNILIGNGGSDYLSGHGASDRLRGGGGRDGLAGGDGSDRLVGEAGDDRLRGEDGRDLLHGGGGRDTITGGSGRDVLIGGAGDDRFAFNAASDSPVGRGRCDVVTAGGEAAAFDAPGAGGGDLFDLTGLGDLSWGGRGKGAIWLRDVGDETRCYVSTDRDARAEFELAVDDGAVLASAYRAADFLFV